MLISEHCRRDPVTATKDETVRDAAKRMADRGVGTLVVIDEARRPIGMVTDRDIVEKALRRRLDADTTRLAEIMNVDLVSVWEEVPLVRAFHRMRQESVRRVLVVGSEGELVGIMTYDDALPMIASSLSLAVDVVRAQQPSAA